MKSETSQLGNETKLKFRRKACTDIASTKLIYHGRATAVSGVRVLTSFTINRPVSVAVLVPRVNPDISSKCHRIRLTLTSDIVTS